MHFVLLITMNAIYFLSILYQYGTRSYHIFKSMWKTSSEIFTFFWCLPNKYFSLQNINPQQKHVHWYVTVCWLTWTRWIILNVNFFSNKKWIRETMDVNVDYPFLETDLYSERLLWDCWLIHLWGRWGETIPDFHSLSENSLRSLVWELNHCKHVPLNQSSNPGALPHVTYLCVLPPVS